MLFRRSREPEVKFAAAGVEVKCDIAFVFAQSGGSGVAPDHEAFSTHMPFPPTHLELGAAIRKALVASRYLDPKKIRYKALEDFYFGDPNGQRAKRLSQAMDLTGALTEDAYFRGIKACLIIREGTQFCLRPTLDGAGSWGDHRLTEREISYVDVGASDGELQAAVLKALAISR